MSLMQNCNLTLLSLVLFYLLISDKIFAREEQSFNFAIGDEIQIMSDKQYRKASGDYFEAIGSVIINHAKNAIYGEKASISFETGDVSVVSNVRYVGEDMTMHGSSLFYNIKNKYLEVNNARIVSNNYTLLGKKIIRPAPGIIIANGAEYTTCRDCPESWSIYGENVYITSGEYVRIKNGYFKIDGVVTMYFPYLIFPIKKGRESGFLFPKLSFALDDGASFKQPYFLVIGPYNDLTFTPGVLGKRGWVSELEYRQNVGPLKWFQVDGLYQLDRVYDLNNLASDDISNHHEHRYVGQFEHHYSFGRRLNHHLSFFEASDLDTIRDYKSFANNKVRGSEIGGEVFFDYRFDMFNLEVEGGVNRNLIFEFPKERDDKYVQVLPKISLSMLPTTLLDLDLLLFPKVSVGFNSDYTLFRQGAPDRNLGIIRNADRVNVAPYVDFNFGYVGPIGVSSNVKYDGQFYRFPKDDNHSFSKHGIVYETEFKLDMEKIFGIAYRDEVDISKAKMIEEFKDEVEKSEVQDRVSDDVYSLTIGKLPPPGDDYFDRKVVLQKDAYRHAQSFKLKHYLTTDQVTSGYNPFEEQIRAGTNVFDYVDAIRVNEYKLDDLSSRQQLPTANTVEMQWNNAMIKKIANRMDPTIDGNELRDSFSYQQIAYLNISQGYQLDKSEYELDQRLTRLFAEAGGVFGSVNLSGKDYYFYDNGGHVLTLTSAYGGHFFTQSGEFVYNSFYKDISRNIKLNTTVRPNDIWSFTATQEYDIDRSEFVKYTNSVGYSPLSNCWKIDVGHSKAEDGENEFSFNFMINYNEKGFTQ